MERLRNTIKGLLPTAERRLDGDLMETRLSLTSFLWRES